MPGLSSQSGRTFKIVGQTKQSLMCGNTRMKYFSALCSQSCLLPESWRAAQAAAFCSRNVLMVSHNGNASMKLSNMPPTTCLKKPTCNMLVPSVRWLKHSASFCEDVGQPQVQKGLHT